MAGPGTLAVSPNETSLLAFQAAATTGISCWSEIFADRGERYGQCAIRYCASLVITAAAEGVTFFPLCADSSLMKAP
jgi:hypothetical protein